MGKVIFILHCRADLTREQMVEQWSGQQHKSIVTKIPGLTRWVQNHVTSTPGEPICDGVCELWFDSDEATQQALSSPEMGAAVEDAKRFLDMEKTGLIIVEEKPLVDSAGVYSSEPAEEPLHASQVLPEYGENRTHMKEETL